MRLLVEILLVQTLAASAVVYSLMRFGSHFQILDMPNKRSLHTTPVPRLGGAAFGPVLILGAGIWTTAVGALPAGAWATLVGGAAIYALGLADDLVKLSGRLRFAVQGAVAVSVLWILRGQVPRIEGNLHLLGWLILWIWIVGCVNAFNFMDGIDGIAGVQAAIGGCYWMLIEDGRSVPSAILGACILGSALGFLRFNWPPARIFMGDAGSTLFGFVLAMAAVAPSPTPETGGKWQLLVSGAFVLWPFIADTLCTFFHRALRGQNVFEAHRTHLYQRLVRAGWSHRHVTILYGGLAAGGAAISLLSQIWGWPMLAVGIVAAAVAYAGLGGLHWECEGSR